MAKRTKQKSKQLSGVERIDRWCASNRSLLTGIAIFTYVFFSFFTFSLRISEGGDDSTYIIRALSFLEDGKFPSYQGPVYPLILSGLVAIFGTNLAILKLGSWLFLTLAIVLLGKAVSKKISQFTYWGVLLAIIVNYHILYFGSQTYSEAFFMALQSLFFLYLFRLLAQSGDIHLSYRSTLTLSGILLALFLTRTIALAALPALVLFLLLKKQNKSAFLVLLNFAILLAIYIGLKELIWGSTGSDNAQLQSLLMRHPYDSSQGKESLGGFLLRFIQNSNIYLSKHFAIFTGFKAALSLSKQPFITIILYLWFFTGLYRFYRHHPYLFFIGLYLVFTLGTTFIALQPLWDQERLIIPFYPLILIFLAETLITLTRNSPSVNKQILPVVLLSLVVVLSTTQTVKQTDFQAIFRNLSGDRFYGYTPDWQNYLKMAEYTSEELPITSYVACRKPNMARLMAGGKKFYGIYRFDSQNADTLISQIYERGVTHIIVASLRKNPRIRNGQVINTIHRYMKYIEEAYPGTFLLRKQIGREEPAWLFEINYDLWQQKKKTSSTTSR
ncbi:hypothetical protein ACT29H_06065 [Thermophagus sp. OGC60D27]|uniref:hypothetical protein n=1 Tax=Thermophagus sp. OGC60D27 TaxID=3458415 RepID=UPI004037C7F7